mmetsp:Transcript_94217/g.253648  ORF Transcript_94217/g.253648 Transcript_94217/m.253648 type:complete len:82 (-) Transcript_94217:296-541(-)
MVPTTLGNLFAGAFCVAFGYAYAFGSIGGNNKSPIPVSRCSQEDLAEPAAWQDAGLKATPDSSSEPAQDEEAPRAPGDRKE